MKRSARGSFGPQLKALREAAGFTQDELASIAGLSVQAVSALERGERRRPHVETVRSLAAALDLKAEVRDALVANARAPVHDAAVDELGAAAVSLPLTGLVGREREVDLLRRWLADPEARLISLVGPGGVGKTRLAFEVARVVAADGGMRVICVELAAVRQPSFVALAIAEGLGLSDVTALDLPRHLRSLGSRERPILLVLDNCEQVLDAAPLIADLARSAPTLRVLATSRAALRLRGERLFAVEPLPLPDDADHLSPGDLAREPAVRLFLERIREVQPSFRLTAANAPTVTAICRRLDALPLALELAAPWLAVLTPDDLLARLQRRAELPGVGARDLPPRQQTMQGTVGWSYELLGPDEQQGFRRLGVLPGAFPIDAATAVLANQAPCADAALVATAALIDKCLLRRVDGAADDRPLYRMLETVRSYAVHELTAAGEREAATEQLVQYCLAEASRAGQGLVSRNQVSWLQRVRDDLDSYRAALTWLTDRGRAADAAEIAWGLLFFWFIRGHVAEGLRWYEAILALPSLPRLAEARVRAGLAVIWYACGEVDRARAASAEARVLGADAGATDVVALADLMRGHADHLAGDIVAARGRFAASIESFRAVSSPWGIGNALCGMGWVALAVGDYDGAERLIGDASAELRDAGPWFGALGLYVLAMVAARREDADLTIAHVRESLVLIREVADRFAFVHVMVPLAVAAALKRDDAWAARILGARDAVAERTGATVADSLALDLVGSVERDGRARLGADRWTRAYASGRTASIDSLLRDIERAGPG